MYAIYIGSKTMTKKNRKIALFIFITTIVIVAIVGYSIWNEPHRDIKRADGAKVSAVELYSYLTKDSATMKSKFVNNVVIVLGEVKKVLKNQNGDQIILLKTNIPDGSINCTMEEKANNVKPGNTISIKGICSGYIGGDLDMGLSGDVFLIRCYPSI